MFLEFCTLMSLSHPYVYTSFLFCEISVSFLLGLTGIRPIYYK